MSYETERYDAPLCPNRGLRLIQYGWQTCHPGHVQGPVVYRHYSLTFILSGKGTYTADGKTHRLSAGQAFSIFPDTSFLCRADEHDPWRYVFIVFHGSDAPALLESAGITRKSPFFSFSNSNTLMHDFDAMREAGKDRSTMGYGLLGIFYCMMGRLIRAHGHERAFVTSSAQRAAEYMAANFPYGITVSDAAAFVGLERSWFYRLFTRECGCSPSRYLTVCRLKEACSMLENTAYTVTEIAISVGFYDAAHFTRVFEQEYGIPPSRWRHSKGPSA